MIQKDVPPLTLLIRLLHQRYQFAGIDLVVNAGVFKLTRKAICRGLYGVGVALLVFKF